MTNFLQILNQYSTSVNIIEVSENLKEILAHSHDLYSFENLRLLYSVIDLTSLTITDNEGKIKAICTKINEFGQSYPEYPNVAGLCVFPSFVSCAVHHLRIPNVKVVAVDGAFPTAHTFFEIKEHEFRLSLKAGARELDTLMPVGKFLEGNYSVVFSELLKLKNITGKNRLKVILETGALKTPENIKIASIIAMEAGADFIKTSTGKLEPAATFEAVYIMAKTIKEFYLKTGIKTGIKPAGGISTVENALNYLAIVKNVLGDSWLNPNLFSIGASNLANNVLEKLERF